MSKNVDAARDAFWGWRWLQDRLALDYGLLQILSVFMYTLLLCHWVACAWRWLPTVLSREVDWLTSYEELELGTRRIESLSHYEVGLKLNTECPPTPTSCVFRFHVATHGVSL